VVHKYLSGWLLIKLVSVTFIETLLITFLKILIEKSKAILGYIIAKLMEPLIKQPEQQQ